MKRKIALLVAAIMIICSMTVFAGNAQAADAEYELDVAITFGQPQIRHIVAVLDEITEKTDGRVIFNVYPSNSLISIPEIPDALKDGVVDLAFVPTINYPSLFSYNAEIVGLPFIGIKSSNMASDCWLALYNEFPELKEEWDNLNTHVIYHCTTLGYNLYFIDQNLEVRTPADLAGHKIMSGKIPWLNFISDQGGAGVQAAPTAYYENLEKGVSDGVLQGYSTVRAFGVLELIHAGTEFGTAGSYYDMFYLAMNNDVWESFPDDIKEAFNSVNYDNAATYGENQRIADDLQVSLEEAPADVNMTVLSDEEIQVWADAIQPYNEAYMDEMKETYKKDKYMEMYEFVLNWVAENADNY